MAGRDGLRREAVDHLEERVPAGVGQHRGAGLARPAGAFLATGRQVEGDDQDLAAAVVEQAEPLAARWRSRRASVRRPSPGSTGRPRPVAGVARRARRAGPAPSGKPMPSWVPSYPVRAISSRIVGASVPCRRSARSTLFHRIGTVPIDAPGRASPGRRRAERRSGRAPTSRARAVIDAAPRPRRPPIVRAARDGAPGSGRPTSRSCPGRPSARSRSTITWTSDGPPDASARRTAGATSAGSFDPLGMEAEGAPDVVEGGGVERAVRRPEIGPRRAAEERLLAALDADPARVVEDDRRRPGCRPGPPSGAPASTGGSCRRPRSR